MLTHYPSPDQQVQYKLATELRKVQPNFTSKFRSKLHFPKKLYTIKNGEAQELTRDDPNVGERESRKTLAQRMAEKLCTYPELNKQIKELTEQYKQLLNTYPVPGRNYLSPDEFWTWLDPALKKKIINLMIEKVLTPHYAPGGFIVDCQYSTDLFRVYIGTSRDRLPTKDDGFKRLNEEYVQGFFSKNIQLYRFIKKPGMFSKGSWEMDQNFVDTTPPPAIPEWAWETMNLREKLKAMTGTALHGPRAKTPSVEIVPDDPVQHLQSQRAAKAASQKAASQKAASSKTSSREP